MLVCRRDTVVMAGCGDPAVCDKRLCCSRCMYLYCTSVCWLAAGACRVDWTVAVEGDGSGGCKRRAWWSARLGVVVPS